MHHEMTIFFCFADFLNSEREKTSHIPPRMSDGRTALARLKASRARQRGGDNDSRVNFRPSSPRSVARDRVAYAERPQKDLDFSGIDEPQTHQPVFGSFPRSAASTTAAQSHKLNDAYLERMDDGFRALGIQVSEPNDVFEESNTFHATGVRSFVFGNRDDEDENRENFKTDGRAPFRRRAIRASETRAVPQKSHTHVIHAQQQRWLRGLANPAGVVTALSDKPLTCVSLAPASDVVVVGGTDHALYEISFQNCGSHNKPKTHVLRGGRKGHGHREWVTCVTHDLTRGDAVSGGMDSKVCVWSGSDGPCDLIGHAGSVSDVVADNGIVASASYDKTVRLWQIPGSKSTQTSKRFASRNVSSKTPAAKSSAGDCVATLRAHKAPTLRLAVAKTCDTDTTNDQNSLLFDSLASGDRDGAVVRWDVSAQSVVSTRDAHEGHCTSLRWINGVSGSNDILVSGGQDGTCCFWDDRQSKPVATVAAHVREVSKSLHGKSEVGFGAVSEIAQVKRNGRLVTAGADGRAAVLDPRTSFSIISTHALGDFAYSLCVAPDSDVAFVGDGSGNVHVLDVDGGGNGGVPRVAYALGAHQGATRALVATRDGKLCAAGDDGNVMTYAFEAAQW